MMGLPILTQSHSWIALVIHKRGQQTRGWIFKALDASHIADKILSHIAVYGPPFLIWQIGYSVNGNHHLYTIINRTHIYVREAVLSLRSVRGAYSKWNKGPNGAILCPAHYSLRNRTARLTKFDKTFLIHPFNTNYKYGVIYYTVNRMN